MRWTVFVARVYDQKTRLGTVLDPLADKLMINIAFVFLAWNNAFKTPVPGWFPVIVLGRDAIIVMGSYLINEFFGPVRIKPRLLGKLTTVFQMSSIAAVLLEVSFCLCPAYGDARDIGGVVFSTTSTSASVKSAMRM